MYCKNCGREIEDRAVICPSCGVRTGNAFGDGYENEERASNGYAIAGFICAWFVSLLGLIFGCVGMSKAKVYKNGKGLSVAAIVISSLKILFYLVIFFAAMMAYDGSSSVVNLYL